jgi:hypothetical protein
LCLGTDVQAIPRFTLLYIFEFAHKVFLRMKTKTNRKCLTYDFLVYDFSTTRLTGDFK